MKTPSWLLIPSGLALLILIAIFRSAEIAVPYFALVFGIATLFDVYEKRATMLMKMKILNAVGALCAFLIATLFFYIAIMDRFIVK